MQSFNTEQVLWPSYMSLKIGLYKWKHWHNLHYSIASNNAILYNLDKNILLKSKGWSILICWAQKFLTKIIRITILLKISRWKVLEQTWECIRVRFIKSGHFVFLLPQVGFHWEALTPGGGHFRQRLTRVFVKQVWGHLRVWHFLVNLTFPKKLPHVTLTTPTCKEVTYLC